MLKLRHSKAKSLGPDRASHLGLSKDGRKVWLEQSAGMEASDGGVGGMDSEA